MDRKESLQHVWAVADKQSLDIMTKKSQRLSSDFINEDSSDGTSDSDSDSNCDFIALPEEFRPNLRVNKQSPPEQKNVAKISLIQPAKNALIQGPTTSGKPASNTLSNESKNRDETSSLQNNKEVSVKHNDSSVCKTGTRPNLSVNKQSPPEQRNVAKISFIQPSKNALIQGPTTSGKPSSNTLRNGSKNRDETSSLQNNKEVSVKHNDSSVCKTGANSKVYYQIVKKVVCQKYERCEEISENTSGIKGKILTETKNNPVRDNEILSRQNAVSVSNECKNKKSLKYEFVQREERQTIHLNFDALTFKAAGSVLNDGLKYETKSAGNAYMSHKNTIHMGNRIRKPNARKNQNLMAGQYFASSEQSTVKWDSSLSLSNEQDNKIEWTLIREKTSMRAKRDVTSQQSNNRFVSGNYRTNRPVSKNYNMKHINPPRNGFNNNQHTKPKAVLQIKSVHKKPSTLDCENLFFEKNALFTDNNLKHHHTIESSDSSFEAEYLDSGECSCCLQQYTAGRQNARNVPRQSSYGEESDLQNLDDRSYDKKVLVSDGNKKPLDFDEYKQLQRDLGLPAGLSFTRRENVDAKLLKDLEEKRKSILRYGREISDLIIGSYIALNMLISFYREWTHARRELIFHFEELGKHLKESSKRFSGWTDILQFARSGAEVAAVIPHPAALAASKAVCLITGLLQTFLKTKKTEKANIDDSNEITRAMLKDTNATSDLYMYGLQCSQQFEETTELIKKFHSDADIQGYFDKENSEIATFIRDFLEFSPNHRVFYKKLHKCFQELLQTGKSDFSRQFCEPFTLYSSPAIDVIEHLGWRFRNDDFDGSSVRHELEEINRSIQNSSSTCIDALRKRIQNCIGILKDELEFMESRMKEISLFDVSSDSLKLFNK